MIYWDVFSWFIILGIIGIWIVFIFWIIEKKNFGKIILRFSERGSIIYLVIGLGVLLISVLNFWVLNNDFSFRMKVMNLMVYPTVSMMHLYIWVTKIQFRENGIIWRNFAIKYSEIESYQWLASGSLEVVRKTKVMKKFDIQVKIKDQPEIDKYLEEKVANRYHMIDNFSD